MSLQLADYERQAKEATMAFWGNREKARQKQIEAGNIDQASGPGSRQARIWTASLR